MDATRYRTHLLAPAWDQTSLLVQVGLIDRDKLPVAGAEQVDRLLDPDFAVQHADPATLIRTNCSA